VPAEHVRVVLISTATRRQTLSGKVRKFLHLGNGYPPGYDNEFRVNQIVESGKPNATPDPHHDQLIFADVSGSAKRWIPESSRI